MSEPIYFDEEFKKQWLNAFEQARADRERYFSWLKDEIKIAVDLINNFDKIYVLGGLGARLLQTSPNLFNQFIEINPGEDKEQTDEDQILEDDEIEILLEYAMNIASCSSNENPGKLPSHENIEEIRNQLSKIKFNIGFYEMSSKIPSGGTEFDHWLKVKVMEDELNVRGDGYHSHIAELYNETFALHDGFLTQYYGFNSADIFETVQKFDVLVASKIANPFGASLAYDRLVKQDEIKKIEDEPDEMKKLEMQFKSLFGIREENEDLYSDEYKFGPTAIPLDYIEGYNRLFYIIPENEKRHKIFNLLSHQFGDNEMFLKGKFSGFPLGESVISTKPLIKVEDKFYCFSINLAFRNIFNITANLLETADPVYYQQQFKNNVSFTARDNYIERKVKQLFEKFLSTVNFYHSLDYTIVEDGIAKKPELDILGVGNDTLYIIEVKAGELNRKHRRGAILGLKDRLKETVNEGSYQCYRAEKFINDNEKPEFTYIEDKQRKNLNIDKSKNYQIIKVSVTYEHLATVSVNLRYLIESGVLSPDYKWTWIVSIFDLMVFADLIESENDFKEYLQNRLGLYERNDVEFHDEIDILGFFFENKFPLSAERENEKIFISSYKDKIDKYYTRKDVGMPGVIKPKRKH